jgi:5'(3')-deoxyribonucleotidase
MNKQGTANKKKNVTLMIPQNLKNWEAWKGLQLVVTAWHNTWSTV